jgi:hypothetical protein
MRYSSALFAAVLAIVYARAAWATTYQVGPSRQYTELTQVAGMLAAGDVVEVDGDHTYAPVEFDVGGAEGSPVTVRGVAVNGKLPVISGGDYTVILHGNHFVLESVEVSGGTLTCVIHKANDVTLRAVRIHDCPSHGLLGTDAESGSLTMQYCEVDHCGEGDRHHQVYVATDETAYPGSVFRLEHSFIHDANGGNNIKSRAERTEIYYNWIEGAAYHELDLIGPDGQDPNLAREDSDVVGNVLVKTSAYQIARIGGDGTGDTRGRYRFVGNTMVLTAGDLAIRATDGIDALELHNNVIVRAGGTVRVLRDAEAVWVSGSRTLSGKNNWITTGSEVPPELQGSILGADPGFEDLAALDVRPKADSPLVDKAAADYASPAGHEFPAPESIPLYLPPFGGWEAPGTEKPRPMSGAALDIGAFEYGTGPPLPRPPDAGPGEEPPPGPRNGATVVEGSCGCRVGGRAGTGGALALVLALLWLRRVRRAVD